MYMHVEYELPLNGMLPMLKRWNATEPPNRRERWRQQSNRTASGDTQSVWFIDDPSLVAQIR
jgi:deoxyribonuclease-1